MLFCFRCESLNQAAEQQIQSLSHSTHNQNEDKSVVGWIHVQPPDICYTGSVMQLYPQALPSLGSWVFTQRLSFQSTHWNMKLHWERVMDELWSPWIVPVLMLCPFGSLCVCRPGHWRSSWAPACGAGSHQWLRGTSVCRRWPVRGKTMSSIHQLSNAQPDCGVASDVTTFSIISGYWPQQLQLHQSHHMCL